MGGVNQMGTKKGIGIFGGTFDPIHLGHLQLALETYQQLELEKIIFIPCYQSPHKGPTIATGNQRLDMIKLAIHEYPFFSSDSREILRKGKSYMVDTLTSFHNETDAPLFLLMSVDAFNKFNYWHEWQKIMQLAHLVVVNRPGNIPHDQAILDLLNKCQVFEKNALLTSNSGLIFSLNMEPNPISATNIRALIKQKQNVSHFLTSEVWQYIKQNRIYY